MYLGAFNPSPAMKDGDPDKAKLKNLGRCTSVISFKLEKPSDKDWKIKKTDIPGPGHVELDKSYNLTLS
jgi:hypothetical protein